MSTISTDFDRLFESLTANPQPFPWQKQLFCELAQKEFRLQCDIPTGLGKTAVIHIWLLALAHHVESGSLDGFPRRLVYVVNRRTVVDQATREAERLREALIAKPELKPVTDALRALAIESDGLPLAISTLRGQSADNAEWRTDPARPAVIVGTVDMVGSRLLFSGYGCGFRSKPLHAGFLGQDVLLIHDEAHLEPPFQALLAAIRAEQQRCREFRVFHIMELTATSRTKTATEFPILSDADLNDAEVIKRIKASKSLRLHSVEDKKQVAEKVAELALKHKMRGQAIIVFLRELDDVNKVYRALSKAGQQVQMLTGILRGKERDDLAKTDPIFARFMPRPQVEGRSGTVYLLCTSAGEVGVDISADHMVCDLTPFDSMAQRLGRVNRFGGVNEKTASVDVVHVTTKKEVSALSKSKHSESDNSSYHSRSSISEALTIEDFVGSEEPEPEPEQNDTQSPVELATERTLLLLKKLPERTDGSFDASPAALRGLPDSERIAAFTPAPFIRPVSDILFDFWALTSVREKLPGRPPVADWLHGVAEWDAPETYVAWRQEVGVITGEMLARYSPDDLLEDYPLKPHELLRDRSDRVRKELEKIAVREPGQPCWLLDAGGEIRVLTMEELVYKSRQKKPTIDLKDCTVILPPKVGGLKNGMLAGDESFNESKEDAYDVSDLWVDEDQQPRRRRIWDDANPPQLMRLVRTINTRAGKEEEADEREMHTLRCWRWYVRPRSADDDGSRTARVAQELQQHLQAVRDTADLLVGKLGMKNPEAKAIILAAKWHDLGKRRSIWQRSIGNHDFPQRVLAKSGASMTPVDISSYRHEFGSLLEVRNQSEFLQLDGETRDLVLHLVAAHHGRARPHFPVDEAFDPDGPDDASVQVACAVPRRFARLQRKYGRWGLAYLESLVRAADALASQALRSNDIAGRVSTRERKA